MRYTSKFWMFFLLFWVGLGQLQAQTELQPLPVDPKVRYGKLSNGLTYYIRHNELPKERADFYIAQNVGSILEEENQRGLAHFLEHMAFNGSKNFPDHAMDQYTESVGMRMGENFNAYTSFDETVYMIMNAPVQRTQVVDSCLLILHDWSNFITLADTAIEKERGVIREEWRTRQDAQARLWEQQLPKMYPNNRYAHRMPIGTLDVINNFKPDELRAYYKKWYRPDLQAIIIVGDVDVDQVENRIKTMFADIPAPVNAAERTYFNVPDNDEPIVSIATDKEASNILLYIFYKYDPLPKEVKASVMGMVTGYVQAVCDQMINERFQEILQKANPPFIYAVASDGDFMVSKTKSAWSVAALAKEGCIDSTLTAVVKEIQRVKQYGFTASEYERARINVLKAYESAFNERDKQKNSTYSSEYVSHFTDGGSIPGIEMEYELINQIAPAIPVEQVNQYIQQIIGDKNIVISLTAPEKEGVTYPTEEELLAEFRKAQQIPVEAYQENVSNEPLIPELPKAGSIVEEKVDPLFGAMVMKLSNGVRVVLKHTDFKDDEIQMTATSPGGTSLYGDEEALNLKLLNSVIGLGGLGNFSATDLSKRLAGKKVSCSTSIGTDSESVNGYASPTDIKTLFELVYLGFTALRTDNDAYQSLVSRLKAQLENQELDPMYALQDSIIRITYQNNPRMKSLKASEVDQISYPRLIEIYKDRFADASDFTFTFVGNLNIDSMRPLIQQYLATLPSIHRTEKADVSHEPAMTKGEHICHFHREQETPKATIYSIYSGQMTYDLQHILSASMLSQILDLVYTEKVREEEGGTYGVQAGTAVQDFPEGRTILQIVFDTDPAKWKDMNQIVRTELQRIAKEGPRQEDFKKTFDNMQKRHEEKLQENGYWLNVLDVYYCKGLDALTPYTETLQQMTPETIRTFTDRLLKQGNFIEVVMEP